MIASADKICPICSNVAVFGLSKGHIIYHRCTNCLTLFSDPLDQEGLVGGGAHEERNVQQNHLRIARVEEMCLGMKKEDVFILDFGCGFFRLGQDLKDAGFVNTYGYDSYNPEFSRLPERDKFHICLSVETFEHFSAPFIEIDVIHRALKENGVCYTETGFLNATWEDGVDDESNPYINPAAGHSTIWTHHGMDVLMCSKNFKPTQRFNRHCLLYVKK